MKNSNVNNRNIELWGKMILEAETLFVNPQYGYFPNIGLKKHP
jgi:hypothetical protein